MNYAGFWKRFAAAIIDGIIVMMGSAIIGAFFSMRLASEGALYSLHTAGDGFSLILGWLYFAAMESSPTQGTLGKMALGIKVTDLDGLNIGFGKATGRYFGKIISTLTLLVGYVMVAFTQKKQGLHDIMAGCLVVDR